jgi:hypothetical protein
MMEGDKMPMFKLSKIAIFGLDGKQASIERCLEMQTEKALLVAVIHRSETGERKVCYWMPKSQVLLDGKKVFGEIDLTAAKKIEIPEWLWDKRVAV